MILKKNVSEWQGIYCCYDDFYFSLIFIIGVFV